MSNAITTNKNLVRQDFDTSGGTLPTSAVTTTGLTSGTVYTTWDKPENYNAAALDLILGGIASVSVTSASGTIALTADKYQPMAMVFTGTLTDNLIYTIPANVGGTWVVRNNTTGSYTITLQSLTSGASATAAIPQDGLPYVVTVLAQSGGGAYLSYYIPDGSITTDKIANGAVTTAKLGDYSITNEKLLPSVIDGLTAKSTLAFADEFSIYDSAAVLTISGFTFAGGGPTYTATATTSAAHGLTTGNSVTISGATGNTSVNGIFTVTVTTTTQFTITVTSSASVTGSPVVIQNPGLKKITYLDLLAQMVPTGTVNPFAGSAEPAGWLLCYGQAISRTTYAALFAVIGTTYGVGDGSTTFNVPDLRGRAIAGKDNMGGSAANRLTSTTITTGGSTTLGGYGGAQTHQLTIPEMPSHTHTSKARPTDTTGGNETVPNQFYNGSNVTTYTTNATGGDGAHNNVQPTIILNYIIKI